MEQKDINNSLSVKIYCAVMQETAKKYAEQIEAQDAVSPQDDDSTCNTCDGSGTDGNTSGNNTPAEAQASSSPTIQALSLESSLNDKPKAGKGKMYAIIAAIALIIVGVAAYYFTRDEGLNSNNPLGVQKPNWERFVRITDPDTKVYETPNSEGNILMKFREKSTRKEKLVMRDIYDKTGVPDGHILVSYDVDSETVFPVLDESEDWYKVYIGVEGVREGFVMKSKVEEVKPEPISKELLDSIWVLPNSNIRTITEGEFANIVLEQTVNQMTEDEFVEVSVMTEGCIVSPKTAIFFPRQEEVDVAVMRNTATEPNPPYWEFVAPKDYCMDSDGMTVLNIEKLTDVDLRMIIDNLRPSQSSVSKVSYYFPTVTTDHFISFEYSFSPVTTVEDNDGNGNLVTDYKVEDGKLLAEINGEYINTEISNVLDVEITLTTDLDEDGSTECVITGHPDGEMLLFRYVVMYDTEQGKFVVQDIINIGEPKVEDADNGKIIVMRRGLHCVKYGMENHSLKKLSDEMKDVGTVILSLSIDDVINVDRKVIGHDIDDDGTSDQIILVSVDGADGDYVNIESISFGNGTSVNTGIEAQEIKILKEKTSGMPDIIGDDYLFRWNGDSYEQLTWNGEKFVIQN